MTASECWNSSRELGCSVSSEGATAMSAHLSFLAVLELIKSATIELVQAEPFAPIHVRLRTGN